MNYQEIINNIKKKKSFLCIGLDTDIDKIPPFLKNNNDAVFEFNRLIVDATHQYAIAYKPNLAFYESLGANGLVILEKTTTYIKSKYPELFLIADAKRGDIGNTSKMYAKAFFEQMPFDAITVAPYMGEDSITPFLSYNSKWVILLALTSNKGAADFQFLKNSNNEYLFETILKQSQQWATKENMMYVVGATQASMLSQIRKIVPDHFLLIPGIGAQGGSLQEVAKYGMNNNCGLIVNSSRDIIYTDNTEQFFIKSAHKAQALQNQMEKLLLENNIVI